jgi:hypothetical protein
VALTPLELGVFQYLRQREDHTVSRVDLLREVWGTDYTGGSNVVDAVVRTLRQNWALAAAATSVLVSGGTAHANPTPTPISIEVLTPRAAFTDDVSLQASLKLDGHGTEVIKSPNASRVVTTKVTMQPGAQVPWHTHHGPVFIRRLCQPRVPGRDRIRRARTRPRANDREFR